MGNPLPHPGRCHLFVPDIQGIMPALGIRISSCTKCCFLLIFFVFLFSPVETTSVESASDESSSFRFLPNSLCNELLFAVCLALTVFSTEMRWRLFFEHFLLVSMSTCRRNSSSSIILFFMPLPTLFWHKVADMHAPNAASHFLIRLSFSASARTVDCILPKPSAHFQRLNLRPFPKQQHWMVLKSWFLPRVSHYFTSLLLNSTVCIPMSYRVFQPSCLFHGILQRAMHLLLHSNSANFFSVPTIASF